MIRNRDIMNARDAAAFLGAHVETIRRLARRGEVPCFKVGKDWRFRREALLQWQQTQKPAAAPPRVLVLDDDGPVRRVLTRLLESIGCRVHQAENGVQGVEALAREVPDLVLLDLVMPKMSGADFLDRIRPAHPSLPVIIVTGYPDGDQMPRAVSHGPLLLLAKPVDLLQLAQATRMVLGDRVRLFEGP